MPLERLSGGQQNLALLVRAQLKDPDVLLMDEPSNHMDITALGSLQRYLVDTRDLTCVMISHDRALLDVCCTSTVFLPLALRRFASTQPAEPAPMMT